MKRSTLRGRIGLAMGGGAARGMAHFGVLRALAHLRVPVDVVVGTSMGAVAGALSLTCGDIREFCGRIPQLLRAPEFDRLGFEAVRRVMRESGAPAAGTMATLANFMRRGYYYSRSLRKPAVVDPGHYEAWLATLIPDIRIEDLPLPFAVVATDLIKGVEVVLRKGPLRRAVAASSAMPGVLPPVQWENGRLLVDGSWVDPLPWRPARLLGADAVIGVDVSERPRPAAERELGNALEIVARSNDILRSFFARRGSSRCDVLISPDVGGWHWADFTQADEILARGEAAALARSDRLRSLQRRATWLRWSSRSAKGIGTETPIDFEPGL